MAASSQPSVRQGRPPPFTPKRPLSQSGSMDDTTNKNLPASGSIARFPGLARATTPLLSNVPFNPPAKKYKAAVSTESRVRTLSRPQSSLGVPGTPTKRNEGSRSRSTTPLPPGSPRTPKRGSPSKDSPRTPSFYPDNEMDVSVVDPEQVLVDFQNVDVDLSAEIDDAILKSMEYGKEDKVLVSIRVRPVAKNPVWSLDTAQKSIKIQSQHVKSAVTPQEFHFDEILTGSENKSVYNAVARSHVSAAMEGYNSVIFAYGQTASGKTFTLTGNDQEPGIIPRAMKDVFSYIRRTPTREYLLRCSYLEIYNEIIYDLLCPPSSSLTHGPVNIQGSGDNVILTPLREEVVTSLKGVKEVIERGYANRRTASTDWNERSSRSHSIFRMVIESRERGSSDDDSAPVVPSVPPTPGGPKLQAKGGRIVQTSILSLIDLAGSEKATSDKDRTREGKYINTSLLTLGTVISTIVENSAKGKSDHIPYRNSKLTRMLQPSLSGNARISVICTINPEANAIAETTSTLLFAQRVKRVQLNAKKKEVVDTDALLERYRKEIEDLKRRLAEREEAPVKNRRLSSREQNDESKAMSDLQSRIQQLTKLILTSQTVDETKGDESRPTSPAKVDFDLSPYQLQQELLSARRQNETQATQILSLEAALLDRPELPPDAPECDKDKMIADQAKTIRELEIVVRGYEENLGEPLRAVKEDVEKEWSLKLEAEIRLRAEKEAWAELLVLRLEKEKQMRLKLEEERRALSAFVSKFDNLGASQAPARLRQPMRIPSSASAYSQSRKRSYSLGLAAVPEQNSPSPFKVNREELKEQVSLLDQTPEDLDALDAADASFELMIDLSLEKGKGKLSSPARSVLGSKENVPL